MPEDRVFKGEDSEIEVVHDDEQNIYKSGNDILEETDSVQKEESDEISTAEKTLKYNKTTKETETKQKDNIKVLPRGYRGIELGMNLDTTKSSLKERPEFGYHGERDVSLLPGENRVLIETDAELGHGSYFLKECYFQFFEDYLYIITININNEKMDYYSMFTTLTNKYGAPADLNPQRAKWENNTTIVYLEKPLTLKYIDKATFEKTNSKSQIGPGPVEITREIFLEDL